MGKFSCIVPRDKEETLKILGKYASQARVAAGCTNVLPDIKSGKRAGGLLVDISRLEELKGINDYGDRIAVGSLVTISELVSSEVIAAEAAVLWQACRCFADPLVRNRATIGGNLANASPAADGVVPLLSLDATVTVESLNSGKKEIPVTEFFSGPGESVLQPDELITSVTFPKAAAMKSGFIKFGLRKSMAISLASIGVVMGMYGGKVTRARIALGALAPTPIRAVKTEDYLQGKALTPEVLEEASGIVRTEVNPISDVRASREYRVYLAGVLLGRAVKTALAGGV